MEKLYVILTHGGYSTVVPTRRTGMSPEMREKFLLFAGQWEQAKSHQKAPRSRRESGNPSPLIRDLERITLSKGRQQAKINGSQRDNAIDRRVRPIEVDFFGYRTSGGRMVRPIPGSE